ncbi:hypothetical protein ACFWP5_14465 [Streptomyces sp. NPDC058469]|uniref:hypothetical protein n=1 Tax=Streptomyces sp. NPDC058469 TaxID=3346514 RepID=UPI00364AB0D8
MSQSLPATVRRALDEHLPADARIATVPQLELALRELAIDLGPSADRSTCRRTR